MLLHVASSKSSKHAGWDSWRRRRRGCWRRWRITLSLSVIVARLQRVGVVDGSVVLDGDDTIVAHLCVAGNVPNWKCRVRVRTPLCQQQSQFTNICTSQKDWWCDTFPYSVCRIFLLLYMNKIRAIYIYIYIYIDFVVDRLVFVADFSSCSPSRPRASAELLVEQLLDVHWDVDRDAAESSEQRLKQSSEWRVSKRVAEGSE